MVRTFGSGVLLMDGSSPQPRIPFRSLAIILLVLFSPMLASISCDFGVLGGVDATKVFMDTQIALHTQIGILSAADLARYRQGETQAPLATMEPTTQEPLAYRPPTLTPSPLPIAPISPEEAHQGTHAYGVAKTEISCIMEVSSPYVSQTISFSEDSANIAGERGNGNTYSKVGEHRYIREVPGYTYAIVFSIEGYTLEVYRSGETDFCGYFTFTLEVE